MNGVELSEQMLHQFELKTSSHMENVRLNIDLNIFLYLLSYCFYRSHILIATFFSFFHLYLYLVSFLMVFICICAQGTEKHKDIEEIDKEQEHHEVWRTFKEVLSSKILVIRGLILFFIWATDAFVFYGLSLNSTSLSGNKYVNFILVCLGKCNTNEY